jgi:hypothetical protein
MVSLVVQEVVAQMVVLLVLEAVVLAGKEMLVAMEQAM